MAKTVKSGPRGCAAGNSTRREWLRLAGIGAAGWTLSGPFPLAAPSPAQEQPQKLPPLNRFPQMVQEYYVRQVRAAEQAGLRAKRALKTKADAEQYVRQVREKILGCFGPLPERTPLKPRITGIVERDVYQVEKLIFESRPGFLVTANLYVPKGRPFPLPGVVGTCGHSDNGKCAEPYQAFAQGLARQGYVVLIYDPIGQGERLQYTAPDLSARLRPGTRQHLHAGNQQFLVGEFLGMWRAWDGIRALDYLLTREEVDPRHVGVTGNSGGGTMTTWLCGVEPRWTMAAPSCFVTTFRRNLENELPADTEQCPPRVLAMGLDHDDFIAAMAPKPVILLTKERDYFDIRGAEESFARLKNLYRLLGAEDNIALFTGPTYHGYSQENREAMYRWFNRVTRVSSGGTEPPLSIEKDETLWCTPHGQVAELESRTVYSYTRDRSLAFASQRGKVSGKRLTDAVSELLKMPARRKHVEFRILRPLPSNRGYPHPYSITYAVDTEQGVAALVSRLSDERLYSRPPRGPQRAILYVAHQSSDLELREESLVRELLEAEPESPLFACDVRGIGESRPNTCGLDTFGDPYGSDYFYAAHAIMLDAPYVGRKTYDVLCVLDWLYSTGHREIHVAGRGWGAIPAALASLLDSRVTQVTLKNAPVSYSAIAESEMYEWPLSAMIPGVLARFDLPDCYEALQSKQVRLIEPRGA